MLFDTIFPEQFLIGVVVVINMVACVVMLIDKRRSTGGGIFERVPEGILFFLATIGGSAGIYASMFVFRHKTRKWYFQLGIPLLILQNLATVYIIKEFLLNK